MEIFIYFCMVIIWFLFLYLAKIYEVLGMVCIWTSFLVWFPYFNILRYKNHYIYAEERGPNNPFYERGMLRINPRVEIGAELRGLFVCQIISIVPFLMSLVYMLRANKYDSRIPAIEYGLSIIIGIIFLIWAVVNGYYRTFYKRAFHYTESPEGIWQPFKYITESANMGNIMGEWNSFLCGYYVGYDILKEIMKRKSASKGFDYMEKYTEQEKESVFFLRKEKESLSILELIHIKEYTYKEEEYLNEVFAKFWKAYLKNIQSDCVVEFIFLLCVDKETPELWERFLDVRCVHHKKGRYRLPVILTLDEEHYFRIVANSTSARYYKQYQKMQNELMEMLGITLDDKCKWIYVDDNGDRIDKENL